MLLNIKKTVMAIVCTISCLLNAGQFKDLSQVRQLLVGIHTRTFSVDDLFNQKINIKDWYDLSDKLEKYITENNKSGIFNSKDSSISDSLKNIKKVNIEFCSLMQMLWGSYFYKKNTLTANDFIKMRKEVGQLPIMLSSVKKEYNNKGLGKIIGESKPSSKKNAAIVLQEWALFLETTIQKAIKDFNLHNASQFMRTK